MKDLFSFPWSALQEPQIIIPYHRPLVGVSKLLTCQSHGGRVDDRHQLLDILREQLVKEALVAVQEVNQVHVLVQGVLVAAH
jgi:hypothetical protein